jgi:hypothetical protein
MENISLSQKKELDDYFTFIVPLFGLLMMLLSRFIYNRIVSGYKTESDFLQKVIQYRTAKIISWAMIEAASILALVASILTLNYLYIAVFVLLFGYFLLSRPTRESFVKDFRLTSDESDKFFKS